MRVAILVVSLALAAGPALADGQVAPGSSAPKAKKEKVICKERVKANSRFTTRSCMTAAQWEAQTETARSAFSEIQNRQMIDITRSN